jgi:hypothetical protein
MKLPYLLPWVRVLLLIRHHLNDMGPRGVATGEAGAPPRIRDAPADRARGLVELDTRGRRLRAALAAALRLGVLIVITFAAFGACAPQAVAPMPLKIPAPPLAFDVRPEPPGWVPITDFATRIEVPGVSMLPPQGRRWVMGRFRQEPYTSVAFGARGPGKGLLFAIAATTPIPLEDWPAVRSLEPSSLADVVRQSIRQGFAVSMRLREVEAQADTRANAACANYRVEGDSLRREQSGAGQPGVLLARGRACLHPDAPRLIVLMAGQWVPEGIPLQSIDDEVAAFLESLQFLPLAVARRS